MTALYLLYIQLGLYTLINSFINFVNFRELIFATIVAIMPMY